MRHVLKTWSEYFQAVKSYVKPFEVRRDDRNFKIGDLLILKEQNKETGELTGAELRKEVTYCLRGEPFVVDGMVIMGIRDPDDGKSYAQIGFEPKGVA